MIRATLAVLTLAWAGVAAAVPGWSYDAALGAGYDTNPGNAATRSDDRRTAATVDGGVGATWNHPFGLYAALQVRGGLNGEQYADLPQLSNLTGEVRARLLGKPGEGFYVPVLAGWIAGGARDSRDALRDAWLYRGGAYLTEPITTRIQVRAGASFLRRDSTSRVFDGDVRTYEANLDWSPVAMLTLYGGYRRDNGPIVVSADGHGAVVPKTEHLVLQNAADRIEPDAAFGDTWYAFRIHGNTGIATLGVNYQLSQDWSLDGQLRRAVADVDYANTGGGGGGYTYAPLRYVRWLGGVSLLLRF